jgi:hypothetical protein
MMMPGGAEEEPPPPPLPWGECPCVLSGTLEQVVEGPQAMSFPPIWHTTLHLTVTDVLRGDPGCPVGARLCVAHSARQISAPCFPAVGAPCLLGGVAMAARGMMMARMPMRGGGAGAHEPSLTCLRVEERTDASLRDATLGCSLPFGWTADGGAIRSPFGAWSPPEGSAVAAAADAPVCSATGRPVLQCGAGLALTGAMVPPASAEDPTAVSKGGKTKGAWPGGWHEWTNPDGDGEYQLTLTNTTDAEVTVPALLKVGTEEEPRWAASALVECGRRCYPLPFPPSDAAAAAAGADISGVAVAPTVLGPGESVATVVNVLALEGPEWPRGGSRLEFNFWLGDLNCGPFSLYYMSSHHDTLRKEMGCAEMDNFQGE